MEVTRRHFGFRKSHSTEHAITQLANKIQESFEKNNWTFGISIDLSKAFDSVDHTILLKKLEIYGIADADFT